MEAIKRQASKFREQAAKQQQHFQREIVRGVESSVSTMKKQLEIESWRKIVANLQMNIKKLAVMQFGTAHSSIEDEKEAMLGIFVDQVSNPLRTSITGAPLEDARHLTRRCERLRQEVESQAAEVIKRQSRSRDASVESVVKLKNAEARLTEHRASMVVLQREATTAMLSVEDQQQQLTFQKLVTMVGAERSYHVFALDILDELHAKMILEMQLIESSWKPVSFQSNVNAPPAHKDTTISGSDDQATDSEGPDYFMAKVKHPFDAQADGELNLVVDEYVAVYKLMCREQQQGPRPTIAPFDAIRSHQHLKAVEYVGYAGCAFAAELALCLTRQAPMLRRFIFDTRRPQFIGKPREFYTSDYEDQMEIVRTTELLAKQLRSHLADVVIL